MPADAGDATLKNGYQRVLDKAPDPAHDARRRIGGLRVFGRPYLSERIALLPTLILISLLNSGATWADTVKICIDIEGNAVIATLVDSETSRDFVSLLPLTLTLKDYASTEKISDLPRRLSTKGAPEGVKPSVGDVAYYAPWGNLAIFHKDFSYSSGLIKLGSIDSGIETIRRAGPLKARIELSE
jgi:hypothetical protein